MVSSVECGTIVKMNYFHSIKDSDIFDNPLPEPNEYIPRPTVKGIVVDDEGKIALLRGLTHSLFPGGGVEEGESLENAFIRECIEEIGCRVEIGSTLGTALQLRSKDNRKFDTHFFIAKIIGEKGIATTVQEDEQGLPTDWLSKEEVLDLLKKQVENLTTDEKYKEVYQPHFNCRTHLAAFKKYLEEYK